jgi:septum formation topological specificity factor MinE
MGGAGIEDGDREDESMNDDMEFLDFLRDRTTRMIEACFNRWGIDMAYYRVQLLVDELCGDMVTVMKKHTLYDNHQCHCSFCGKPTYCCVEGEGGRGGAVDYDKSIYACAECYGKARRE